jgi:hypothetical protein
MCCWEESEQRSCEAMETDVWSTWQENCLVSMKSCISNSSFRLRSEVGVRQVSQF